MAISDTLNMDSLFGHLRSRKRADCKDILISSAGSSITSGSPRNSRVFADGGYRRSCLPESLKTYEGNLKPSTKPVRTAGMRNRACYCIGLPSHQICPGVLPFVLAQMSSHAFQFAGVRPFFLCSIRLRCWKESLSMKPERATARA